MFIVFILSMLIFFLFFRVAPVVIGAGNPLAPAKASFDPVSAAAGSAMQGNPSGSGWLGSPPPDILTGVSQMFHQAIGFLKNILTFNFGYSRYTFKPVSHEILIRLPYTLAIYLVGILTPILIGYALAVKAVKHRGRIFDYLITISSLISYVVPSYVLLLLLYYLLAFLPKVYYDIYIFPLPTRAPIISSRISVEELFYMIWYLIPIYIALITTSFGQWAYYIRQLLISEAEKDYVVSSRAIGKDEEYIIKKEIIPNIKGPIATSVAYTIPTVFGGSIVLEMLTSWPGVASYAYNALSLGDFPAIVGFYTISVILIIISLYITDVLIAILDPRVKLG